MEQTLPAFMTICAFVAPNDWAASINAGSTSLKLLWNILPINGVAATVSGTSAAVSPIDYPTIILVRGMIDIIRIIKGKDLIIFTTISSIL